MSAGRFREHPPGPALSRGDKSAAQGAASSATQSGQRIRSCGCRGRSTGDNRVAQADRTNARRHRGGLLQFIGEILGEQPPEAPIGALTLRPVRPERDKKVCVLVYVGPLDWRTPDQIQGLVQPKYAAGHAWELEKLLKVETATADEPLGY